MILCIDTITEFAGIALVDSHKCHAYLPFKKERIAEWILGVIDKALKRAHVRPIDLVGVLVIKGPGSFTSLRVGLAVANQFAHQLKIPIVGLRTDEWWMHRTDERPALYLQSMNREEVYVGGIKTPHTERLYQLYNLYKSYNIFGQISEEHRTKLPLHWHELTNLKSPEDTWVAAASLLAQKRTPHKRYALVEPFYGKEPTITKGRCHRL